MSTTQTTRPDIAHPSDDSEAATTPDGAGIAEVPRLPVMASSTRATLQAWDTNSDLERPATPTSVWGRRGVWLGLAAFVVAAIGEALLFAEDKRGLGVILLVAGALVGVTAWNGRRSTPLPDLRTRTGWWRITWRREVAVRLVGVAAAVGLAVGSIAAYISSPNEIFGGQGVLWLAGMAVLVASCARWYSRTMDDGRWTIDDRPMRYRTSVLSPRPSVR